jgi:methionyl-tRNA synthetase
MRAYCAKCREYRSDEGENAWGIKESEFGDICEKCGSIVDVFEIQCEVRASGFTNGRRNAL